MSWTDEDLDCLIRNPQDGTADLVVSLATELRDALAKVRTVKYDGKTIEDLEGRVADLTTEINKLRAVVASHAEDPNSHGFEFTAEEKSLLKDQDRIGAIHSLRRRLGIDLITAKRLVDRGRFW